MIKHVVQEVLHIERYGIASLLIFFLFFAGMLIWAFRLKREFLGEMSQLPLAEEPELSSTSTIKND